MSLRGQYSWYVSLCQGGRKAISFTLTSTNLFQSETFDAVLVDGSGQNAPLYYRSLCLRARQSFRFDVDSCGWYWCQNDFFAILGKNDKIEMRWDLHLPQYAPGECPDCHGSHKCKQCGGKGYVLESTSHTLNTCMVCGGTGQCQTCFIPVRTSSIMSSAEQMRGYEKGKTVGVGGDVQRNRHVAQLRQRISELQEKMRSVDWDLKMMDLKDQNVSMRMVYNSKLELKYRYGTEIMRLQSQLEQLEMQGL